MQLFFLRLHTRIIPHLKFFSYIEEFSLANDFTFTGRNLKQTYNRTVCTKTYNPTNSTH